MIGYVTLGADDVPRAPGFYDDGNKLNAFCMAEEQE